MARRRDQTQLQTHVLHLPATSSLASVREALARFESCEALLVFPTRGAVELARMAALAALWAFCREQEIDAVFIGGDETLRAAAVAAGFAAATSIDAWRAVALEESPALVHPSEAEWAAADAALVAASGQHPGDSGSGWHADPPEYVMRLLVLGAEGGYSGPRDEPTAEEAERLRAEDAAATDPLLCAHYEYEERMTATIRDTGRLPVWQPAQPAER